MRQRDRHRETHPHCMHQVKNTVRKSHLESASRAQGSRAKSPASSRLWTSPRSCDDAVSCASPLAPHTWYRVRRFCY
eukprot:992667-Rhodomonas_salina.1